MLRDLSDVLVELQEGISAAGARRGLGVRLTEAEMTLPMDVRPVFRDGGCVVLADVLRNYADADWLETPSRLYVRWGETPTEELP
ncbi:hypothetical protein GCM10007860_33610 [Chitiniphilus shinanonensis]|uniref:Uncharacterized protein n=1 Tax=Chitiniphilus shinanonensis TaxID=553088 RepID=A0ABQ6C089_9NEIS|nr:hypothetical protein [Chitiniphilus shinanonensis]GLS06191.1 hypothetical protein GCM10007860_33610 [Chitiniphilus shinanonensis]